MCHHLLPLSLSLHFNIWALPLEVFHSPTPETPDLLFYLLPPNFHLFSYTTSHHPACQHFKFILGDWLPLPFLPLVPTVMGHMPKPLATPTVSSLLSF